MCVKKLAAAAAIAVTLLAALSSTAQEELSEERALFNIAVANIRVASLAAASRNNGRSYAVRAILQTQGVVDFFARRKIDVGVRGWLRKEFYKPAIYRETAIERNGEKRQEIRYQEGIPHFAQLHPPLAEDSEPSAMERWRWAIDPATALFVVIRDYSRDEMCDSDFTMFDGEKAYEFALGKPMSRGDEIHCESSFSRIGGFSDEEMAKQVTFPFTLVYRPTAEDPDRFELRLLKAPTEYGTLTASRV